MQLPKSPELSTSLERASDAEETKAHLAEMQSVCGPALGAVKEMPPHLSQLADWAEAEQAKMNEIAVDILEDTLLGLRPSLSGDPSG